MSAPPCRSPRRDAAHLLNCPSCRARARVAEAWTGLTRPELEERRVEPTARFVQTAVASIRRDHTRRTRARLALAAAAALLFFFCVGTGHESAAPQQASPEDSYASLLSPGELTGLIPN